MRALASICSAPRPLAQKILERPELLARLRELVPDRRGAFIMPFNVRDHERDLALELDVPIYGVDHRFARYGIKSGCRGLFASAGVSHPPGANGLSSAVELADGLIALRQARPGLEAAVVKLDDAVYGEGNLVIALRDLPPPGTRDEEAAIDVRLRTLPSSYLHKLGDGGIVEELIAGEIRSPSVQMRILPGGDPVVARRTIKCSAASSVKRSWRVASQRSATTRRRSFARLARSAPRSPRREWWAASGSTSSSPDVTATGCPTRSRSTYARAAPRIRMGRCGCSPTDRSTKTRRHSVRRRDRRSTTSQPTASATRITRASASQIFSLRRRPPGSAGTRARRPGPCTTCSVRAHSRAA